MKQYQGDPRCDRKDLISMTSAQKQSQDSPIHVLLFGAEAHVLDDEVTAHPNLQIVDKNPDVVVCYGGDGTLLAAELEWPGVPKAPILNSRVGHHCIRHPASEVIAALARGTLVTNTYHKLKCAIHRRDRAEPERILTPLNEITVQKGRVNSAVRYRVWISGDVYKGGEEIIGDGFVICTPFGSTAYFSKITRGIFTKGIGIAFNATGEQINHLVLPVDSVLRVLISRGPALLAYDSAQEYIGLEENDELVVHKHPEGATILTCGPVRRLNEPF